MRANTGGVHMDGLVGGQFKQLDFQNGGGVKYGQYGVRK